MNGEFKDMVSMVKDTPNIRDMNGNISNSTVGKNDQGGYIIAQEHMIVV